MKTGILFDLDGTLWEVTDSTYDTTNEITKRYNINEVTRQTICNAMGMQKEDVARLYFPELNLDEAVKTLDEASKLNIDNLRENGGNLYSNLEETLKKLNEKYDLFIVSNTAHKEYIQAFLISSKLGKYFNDYVAASELNISKAEAIKKVVKDYDLSNAIYVGDTQKDYEAASLANIEFIQARYGFGENLNTKYGIDSIDELPSKLTEIIK